MSRDGWRPHIESALCVNLAAAVVARSISPHSRNRGTWTWSRDGEEIASVRFAVLSEESRGTLTLNYVTNDRGSEEVKEVNCVIALSSQPVHFGGARWWMHCPYTGKRALKLYKFNGIEKFCHRTAVRPLPTYAIQRVSGASKIQAQRLAIRRKLRDHDSGLWDYPAKPKWMRWRTFERFVQLDSELAEREDKYMSRFLRAFIQNN